MKKILTLYNLLVLYILFFKGFCLFIFRERGREGEREGEKHQCVVASHTPRNGTWPATQACALTGNRTRDSSGLPALNPLSYTIQGIYFVFKRYIIIIITKLKRISKYHKISHLCSDFPNCLTVYLFKLGP